ncbi:hypothetical protein FNI11_05260 [Salmonella enterica subsp. salamae]|nr:hypothetical protein [Salmonella enterica subsp. salamae]ECJ2280326.1 hypothetical protein [Salmonella enterica subsp. salamae]
MSIPVILQVACALASSFTLVPVPHRRQPSAVHIRSRRICHGVAAFLQLELFRVYMHSYPFFVCTYLQKITIHPYLRTYYLICMRL